jgi:selenium donor protein
LHNHPSTIHPDLLVGIAGADDAGVFRIDEDRAIVQTIDFFTPVVDDPCDWGRITAANALSDIYAMGAEPLTALQMVAWPRDTIPFEVLSKVIEGGSEVMAEAGCTIVGGHSIDDTDPKYGFAITGIVSIHDVVTNAAAKPGQVLILTKPLGTGILSTAIKNGNVSPDLERAAIASMTSLNRGASNAARRVGVSAGTDVTGSGCSGISLRWFERPTSVPISTLKLCLSSMVYTVFWREGTYLGEPAGISRRWNRWSSSGLTVIDPDLSSPTPKRVAGYCSPSMPRSRQHCTRHWQIRTRMPGR